MRKISIDIYYKKFGCNVDNDSCDSPWVTIFNSSSLVDQRISVHTWLFHGHKVVSLVEGSRPMSLGSGTRGRHNHFSKYFFFKRKLPEYLTESEDDLMGVWEIRS